LLVYYPGVAVAVFSYSATKEYLNYESNFHNNTLQFYISHT